MLIQGSICPQAGQNIYILRTQKPWCIERDGLVTIYGISSSSCVAREKGRGRRHRRRVEEAADNFLNALLGI